jgi:hypothetical protein
MVSDTICLFPLGEPVAQSVEHRPFKARALGSSPSRLTINNQALPSVLALAKPLTIAPCAKFVHLELLHRRLAMGLLVHFVR